MFRVDGKALLLGTLLGGLIGMVWSSLSWTVLPWHEGAMREFTDAAAVAQVIKANAPEKGMYFLPGSVAKGASEEDHMKGTAEGPYLYGVVRPGPESFSMGSSIGQQLLVQLLAAFLLTLLVLQTRGLSLLGRALLVAFGALAGGVLVLAPESIWYQFTCENALLGLLDLAIAWFLAGLAIAKVTARATA
ncbi:MAG TPA: hypothetical protein VN783_14870 [Thermoanaerobaculia bacterium]|nr:hypothetical protein [Thermoanaerobaculia bacterium]